MSTISETVDGIVLFVKAATNFVEIIESNLRSYYELKDRRKVQRQLDSIENVLSVFPQIWFFNGLFASQCLQEVSSADYFAHNRDIPIIDDFQKALDEIEETFDREAPKIRGLGSDIVILFKQQVAFRRNMLRDMEDGKYFSEKKLEEIRSQLSPLEAVETRFENLTLSFRNDSIQLTATEKPELSKSAIADEFEVTEMLVDRLLRDNTKDERSQES